MTKDKTKVLFLESSTGGGHLSISEAIIQSLQQTAPDIQIKRIDAAPSFADKAYQLASRQFNRLFHLLYRMTDSQRQADISAKLNLALHKEKLKKLIAPIQPDVVVSNYSLAIREVPTVLKGLKKDIPFLVFVPDPISVHAAYLTTKADLTMVATPTAYQKALEAGIPHQKLAMTGHPVRKDFYINKPNTRLSNKLKLREGQPTILFGGSGDGAERMLEILIYLGAIPTKSQLRRLISDTHNQLKDNMTQTVELASKLLFGEKIVSQQVKNNKPFQAIFVTGRNTTLRKQLQQLKFPEYISPHILGEVKNLHSYLQLSDLVVGKAGPNIIFESVAAGKPFLATYHVKGQENGNLDLIRGAQIGFVEENPAKAADLIGHIVSHPKVLQQFQPGIQFLREQHRQAAERIAQEIIQAVDSKKTVQSP